MMVIIKGLCVVCPSGSKAFIAYPSRAIGQVCLVDLAATEKPVVEIQAHEASIMCKFVSTQQSLALRVRLGMAMNMTGTRLATASEKVFIVSSII